MDTQEPEPNDDFGDELVRVQIKMARSFTGFDEALKARYLADLAEVAGCTQASFHSQIFIRGCVKHELELPRVVAKRLAALFARAEKEAAEEGRDDVEGQLEREALAAMRAFAEKHFVTDVRLFSTLTVRVTENAPSRVVVFVHGWRGNTDSFGDMPEWVAEQTGWKTKVFPYPTGLWTNSPSISQVANSLDNWIQVHCESAVLALVGHSMGGVVVRKMLTEQMISDAPLDIRLAVMCASPHTGTLASLLRKIPTFDSAQLRELDQDSTFLFDLNRYWNWWINTLKAGQVSTKSVIAQKDGVVSLNSAAGLDTSPLVVLGADHRSVVKPASAQDLQVQRLSQWIKAVRI
jgi:pimeloyl-ACP methyl ester carboxylesterase